MRPFLAALADGDGAGARDARAALDDGAADGADGADDDDAAEDGAADDDAADGAMRDWTDAAAAGQLQSAERQPVPQRPALRGPPCGVRRRLVRKGPWPRSLSRRRSSRRAPQLPVRPW